MMATRGIDQLYQAMVIDIPLLYTKYPHKYQIYHIRVYVNVLYIMGYVV